MANKWYKDIHFLANIATIVSIIIALAVFTFNYHDQQKRDREEYVNQLESLQRELEVNYIIKTKYLLDGKESYLRAESSPSYRYYIGIINRLITEGKIKDYVLRDKLYNIADRENEINRVLDGAFFTFHSLNLYNQPDTQQRVNIRISEDNKIAIANAEELNSMLPEVINLIKQHIENIEK